MDNLIVWLKETLWFVIPGAVYLTSAFFGVLDLQGEYDICKIKAFLDNQPDALIITLILVLSYILGMAIHLAMERIYYCRFKSKKRDEIIKSWFDRINKENEKIAHLRNTTYGSLLLLRGLGFALICFYISVTVWLCNSDLSKYILSFTVFCFIFILIILLAYLWQRKVYQEIGDNV
jgi:hypothetical protein